MSVLVITQGKGPDINFVPEPYHQEFIEVVLKLYEDVCGEEHPIDDKTGRFERLVPEVYEIGTRSDEFFVIGAVAMDNEDDMAYGKLLSDPALTEDQKSELLEDWHEEYSYPTYASWHEEYRDDICAVLSYYHMSFVISHCNPLDMYDRWITMNNYPIVEVW